MLPEHQVYNHDILSFFGDRGTNGNYTPADPLAFDLFLKSHGWRPIWVQIHAPYVAEYGAPQRNGRTIFVIYRSPDTPSDDAMSCPLVVYPLHVDVS